ncbi:unnamed protein product [Durusdinium trenchii]|uniref:Uncharacterized protein n=1 Tax=Durusdinium trenchii TaxID=1381693 RepID=A0ABP0K7I4_9DINO
MSPKKRAAEPVLSEAPSEQLQLSVLATTRSKQQKLFAVKSEKTSESEPVEQCHSVNLERLTAVSLARDAILMHPIFSDVLSSPPLSMDEGNHKVAFNVNHATMTLQNSGKYDCSANLFWLKVTHLVQPGVPINERSIRIIMDTKFASPKTLLDQIVVRAPQAATGQSIAQRFGALEFVSPPEVIHALLLRIHERLEPAEEEELRAWRNLCLTCTFVFEKLSSPDEAYWRAVNLREQVVTDFESLARDVSQRVFELVGYRNLMKTTHNRELNNKDLAAAWKQHVIQCESKFSDKVTENFVDTAMKVYNRLFVACPDSLHIIMEDVVLYKYPDGQWVLQKYPLSLSPLSREGAEICPAFVAFQDAKMNGKASPFNQMSALEQITMKCKTPENVLWVMRSIMDYMHNMPDEFGAQNFTFRQLKGAQGSVGYIQLFLTKKEIMEHFLTNVLSKFPRDEFKDFVKGNLTSHQGFRSFCGSEQEAVDLSWQGEHSDAEIQSVQFLKIVVFSKALDGHLKTVLKGTTNIEDVMMSQKVADIVTELMLKLEAEINPGAVKSSALVPDDDCEETKVSLESLVDSDLLEDEDKARDLQEHFKAVQEYVGRFITFRVAEQSVLKTQQALEGTVLKKFPVRGKHWCIWYDTKVQGESSAQPHCRCPPYQKATFKKHVQAALAVRDQSELGEQTLVMCMDGFRSLEGQFSKDLQQPSGDPMVKNRTTFQVAYDEKALRTRKMLTRGMVSQVEGLHVYSSEGLSLQDRDRMTYHGSTHGSLIGPVIVAPFKEGFLLSRESKEKFLGDDGKILAGGACPSQTPVPDLGDKVPVTYYSLPTVFYSEMIHSFELGGVYGSTCMDVSFALACLKSKTPYVGSCLSEFACQALEAEVIRICWKEFLTPESPLYDINLHKLVEDVNVKAPKGKSGRGGKGGKNGRSGKSGRGGQGGKSGADDTAEEGAGEGGKGGKGGQSGADSKSGRGKGGKSKGTTEADIMGLLNSLSASA